jgi:hypothetical protein
MVVMDRVIYFIEDQEALNPYILVTRYEQKFIGWKILATDSIDKVMEWCERSDAKTIFVVDSRLNSNLLRTYLEKTLLQEESNSGENESFLELATNDVMIGALSTIVLKKLKPDCRIILITAFFRTIAEIRKKNPKLDEVLKKSIDIALPKTSPEALTEAIQSQITALKTTA